MLIFKPVLIGFLNIIKSYQHISYHVWDMKFLEDVLMGCENLQVNLDGLCNFWREKI